MHPVRCVVIFSKEGVGDKGVGGIWEFNWIGNGKVESKGRRSRLLVVRELAGIGEGK